MKTQKNVFVMLSGGVDSSVAAADLLEQGYTVVGVYIKCWSIEALTSMGASEDLYGCFWQEEAEDARAVADTLGIPFYVWDFEKEYKQGVVDYMLAEYQAGRTPNPDVMCNSVIKFGMFYQRAIKLADFVATGHYARKGSDGLIYRGKDKNKDQTYFIWNIPRSVLPHTLFPVGEYTTKADVRARAEVLGLLTATKKDSQGLCFIGQTPLRELLLQTIGEKPGEIRDAQGKVLGMHPGAFLYTVGQRHGLDLPAGPWFVVRTDIKQNIVFVVHQLDESELYTSELIAEKANWLVKDVLLNGQSKTVSAQIRYRQDAVSCVISQKSEILHVRFNELMRAVASGQSIVFYDQDVLLGGAVIR
jgi:tRNA-uridine 2-sulfurtransferase